MLSWSPRIYGLLLLLYPARFRTYYGQDMALVFRDCCRDAWTRRGATGVVVLWWRTLADLALSVPREAAREWIDTRSLRSEAAGWVGSFVVLSIIGFHLLVGGAVVASHLSRYALIAGDFVVLWLLSSMALGGVGVACSIIHARVRRIHYRLIGL